MDFWHGFALITVVHLLAAASPGPDFAFVTRQSLVHGRRAGLLASTGIALGLAIHIVYPAAGLAAVIVHSAHWMTAIKLRAAATLFISASWVCARERAPHRPGAGRDLPASPLRQVPAASSVTPSTPRRLSTFWRCSPWCCHPGCRSHPARVRRMDHAAAMAVVLAGGDPVRAPRHSRPSVRRASLDRPHVRRRHGGARCTCPGGCARMSPRSGWPPGTLRDNPVLSVSSAAHATNRPQTTLE